MATHAVRKAAHALAEEGELLNVYSELKDLASALDSRVRQQERATKSLLTWTAKKEDQVIEEFVACLGDSEMASIAVDRQYIEEFRLFTRLWKTVLAEKKELNAKVNAYKKAQKNLEQARKKYAAAETKQPRDEDRLNKARKALESMEQSAAEVERAMQDKLLEVQQEKHTTLRSGYMGLYKATMERLKGLVDQQQQMREVINAFPLVIGRKGDDEFEYGPAPDTEEKPLWARGEELMAELVKLRDTYDSQVEKIRSQHTAEMKRVIRERDDIDAQKSESYSAEVVAMNRKNTQMIDQLEAEHQKALAELKAKLEATEKRLQQSIRELEAKVQRLEAQKKEQHRQILQHTQEVNRLEETLESTRTACVARAVTLGKQAIASTAEGLPRPISAWLLDLLRAVKTKFDEFTAALSDKKPFDEVDAAVDAFAHRSAQVISVAYALAKASKAEDSSSLLEHAAAFAKSAQAVLDAHKSKGAPQAATGKPAPLARSLTKADNIVIDPAKKKQQMVALYDHASSTHGGSVLLGFKKGDVMTLIRKRDDGWCKVVKGSEQGWAPTSYLKPADPSAASTSDAASAPSSPQRQQRSASPSQPPATQPATPAPSLDEAGKRFAAALQSLTAAAKAVIARDRELASLSNALAEGIEGKVTAAQQSVLDTRGHIQKMDAETKGKDKGRRLEVNTNILGLATKLMDVMEGLISAADAMRDALENTRGMQSEDEFNMKHSSWFQGLTTAVDAMVEHNPVLTESLRSVVRQQGKHEELQVSARNLSASVAQLAALSRTKSMPNGDHSQADINRLSEEFKQTVHEILAAVRECKELELASVHFDDYGSLSENDAKRLLMATQVNVLKLESDLNNEHEKLRRLRRIAHYEEKASAIYPSVSALSCEWQH
ncbi:hypothetical protein PTSG_03783 [Salpingoeca rosetta]|uniref:SH3 domain-containing protein n=1 Tax=Salpingoeca rosetta (strain ATCC 50818 / BSB-021) TaxID=946362 RepID=F2U5D5_SALR5|nr:uncharacterized protein PTSG_03783 [Salpingoeca rosetta]EGD83151.1 hypothetical protein PTSG_03783 [Salpingoeca rosetta]|eukprot:XP_004995515.1 hypothetical protein PTSG_03783 [Salpingoeca rosetta]